MWDRITARAEEQVGIKAASGGDELVAVDAAILEHEAAWAKKAKAMGLDELKRARTAIRGPLIALADRMKTRDNTVVDELEVLGHKFAAVDTEIVWREFEAKKLAEKIARDARHY